MLNSITGYRSQQVSFGKHIKTINDEGQKILINTDNVDEIREIEHDKSAIMYNASIYDTPVYINMGIDEYYKKVNEN